MKKISVTLKVKQCCLPTMHLWQNSTQHFCAPYQRKFVFAQDHHSLFLTHATSWAGMPQLRLLLLRLKHIIFSMHSFTIKYILVSWWLHLPFEHVVQGLLSIFQQLTISNAPRQIKFLFKSWIYCSHNSENGNFPIFTARILTILHGWLLFINTLSSIHVHACYKSRPIQTHLWTCQI